MCQVCYQSECNLKPHLALHHVGGGGGELQQEDAAFLPSPEGKVGISSSQLHSIQHKA